MEILIQNVGILTANKESMRPLVSDSTYQNKKYSRGREHAIMNAYKNISQKIGAILVT